MVEIEKRKMERFDLEMPIYLSVADKSNKHESLKFITTISARQVLFSKQKNRCQ
jgi:hypothetical protein